MTIVYGKLDALKKVRETLHSKGITQFNSIGDINEFNKNFNAEVQRVNGVVVMQIASEVTELEKQKDDLQLRVIELEEKALKEFESLNRKYEDNIREIREIGYDNWVFMFLHWVQIKFWQYRQTSLKKNQGKVVGRLTNDVTIALKQTESSIYHLTANRDYEIFQRNARELSELTYIHKALEELNPYIAGAIGESKVQNELKKLPDNNVLFNDYSLKFNTPIYNRKTKDKIFSIQIDHLLLTNAGIFILETKNWSRASVESLDLRSPVKQIERTGFALFVLLNSSNNEELGLKQHHWGNKQVPMRSVVVMINEKPKEQFKYVKVKSLHELNNYITYFDPIFTDEEVHSIADYLKKMRNEVDDIPFDPISPEKPGNIPKKDKSPTGLHEWLKKNAGKGINDYYRDIRGE